MEELLDSLWFKTVDLVYHIKDLLDVIFGPLNSLGPAIAIFAITFVAVVTAKFLTRVVKTKRYDELKKEFFHWYNLRQEASKAADREKGGQLARNIDQAKLNKAYYDFFLEAFLLSLFSKYLPILSALAYVNEAYKPENMVKLFGRDYIFKVGYPGGEAIVVSAVFWFVISVPLIYLSWFVIGKFRKKYTTVPRPDLS